MAKALGNGVPIGACWARADVAAAFAPGDHATTFGGQPLAAAAALATLEVMEAEDVPARAAAAGQRLVDALARRARRGRRAGRGPARSPPSSSPGIDAKAVADECLARGLVLNAVTPTALRLAPPLLVTDDEIAEAVAVVAGVSPTRRPPPEEVPSEPDPPLLEVDDLDGAQFHGLLDHAHVWKRRPVLAAACPRRHGGRGAVREAVGPHPGLDRGRGHEPRRPRRGPCGATRSTSASRESVEDVARTLAGYCSVIMARVYDHAVLEAMSVAVDVPIVNLLSDRAHPCQALADFMTDQGALRHARGSAARLRRRRQQRRGLAGVRRRAVRASR